MEGRPATEGDEVADGVVEFTGALEGVDAGDPQGRRRLLLVAPAAGEQAGAHGVARRQERHRMLEDLVRERA